MILVILCLVLWCISVGLAIYNRELSAIYFAIMAAATLYVWSAVLGTGLL